MRSLLMLGSIAFASACSAPAPVCNSGKRPIVAVHGFLAAGDTYAKQAMRFQSNGYCQDDVHAFDWNTLGDKSTEENLALLDAFIDDVRSKAKVPQVDLAAHSAGCGLAYSYLADAGRAAKVAHYANLAGFRQDAPPGPSKDLPTLNIWSDGDYIITEKGAVPGETNLQLTTEDHYASATGARTFEAMFKHFNDGTAPTTTEVTPESSISLSGRALTLGENKLASGAAIDMYEVDASTGARKGKAVAHFTATEAGYWGPVDAKVGVPYEFVVREVGDDVLPVHYYREPFTHSDHLVYLRSLPDPNGLAGSLLSGIRYDDADAVIIAFLENRGLIAGQDSLKIAGTEVATATLAEAKRSTIAVFAYDDNANMTTDATDVAMLSSFPFLGGMDIYMPASPEGSIAVTLNGHTLQVRNWKSASEGPSVAVFDN